MGRSNVTYCRNGLSYIMQYMQPAPGANGLTLPSFAINGGSASAFRAGISLRSSVISTLFVEKCVISQDPVDAFDAQGRQLYIGFGQFGGGNDSSTPGGVNHFDCNHGAQIAIDALFCQGDNPYRYNGNVVDGSGTFDVSYYCVISGIDGGFRDFNGNPPIPAYSTPGSNQAPSLINQSLGLILGGRILTWPKIPNGRQTLKYGGVLGNANSINTEPILVDLFKVGQVVSDPIIRNTFGLTGATPVNFGGVALGALYAPGSTDPSIGFLHWLQIIGSEDKGYITSVIIADDGTGDCNGVQPQIIGPMGGIMNWGIDCAARTTRNFKNIGYDETFSQLNILPVANTSYFFDTPKVGNPSVTASTRLWLFKFFYTDQFGNYSTVPVINNGNINFTVLRQGMFYGFDIFA